MNYHTDLIFGEDFCIFIFFHFSDSGISVLTVCIVIFDGITVTVFQGCDGKREAIKERQTRAAEDGA